MSSPQLFTVVDDSSDSAFTFGPQKWNSSNFPQWFNSTSQSPTFALNQGSQLGTVITTFQGTSIAYFGNTPPASSSQTFSVSIDGGPPYNTTNGDPNPPSYRQWYQSPLLDEGAHEIVLFNILGETSVDFVVVTVGEDTPLDGTTIIADNDDAGFTYTGRWTRSQDAFNSGPELDGNPYHNSTHRASDVGSFFTYEFSGNSAAIYGIFNWFNLGQITLTFTLDGQSLAQTYSVRPDTPQFISQFGQQQNFLFYEYSFLQAGNHTLTVNLTESINQTFIFDYITYGPSFATLATMPIFAPITGESDGIQSTMLKNSHTGIIAASLGAGGIVLLLCGIIFFLHRRKRKGREYKAVYPFQHNRHSQRSATIMNANPYPPSPESLPMHRTSVNTIQPFEFGHEQLAGSSHLIQPLLAGNIRAPLLPAHASGVTDAPYRPGSGHSKVGGSSSRPWDAGDESTENLPPSYDETTREQLIYFIRR